MFWRSTLRWCDKVVHLSRLMESLFRVLVVRVCTFLIIASSKMPTKSRLLVPYDPKFGPATSRNRSGYLVQVHVEMYHPYRGRGSRWQLRIYGT